MNFFKSVLAVSIAVMVFAQSGSKFVIFCAYLVNKEYIIDVLCVNKDKPSMKCDGKCQLEKKLQEDESRKKDPVKSIEFKAEMQWISESGLSNIFIAESNRNEPNSFYIFSLSKSFIPAVFQPPET